MMSRVDNDSDDSSDNCSHNSSSCQPSQSADDQDCWYDKEEQHNGGHAFSRKDVSVVFLAFVSVLAVSSSFACGYYYPNSIRVIHSATELFLPSRGGLCEDQETPKLDFSLFNKDLYWNVGNAPSVVTKTDAYNVKLSPPRNSSLFYSTSNEGVNEDDDDDLDSSSDDEDDVFALAGHVLIDLNRIKFSSIDTEDKVFGMMTLTIQAARHRLESYVCRKHQTLSSASENADASAIQCLGMLSDGGGHISLYAWPIDNDGGRVFIDLFVTDIVSDAAMTHGIDDGKGYEILGRSFGSTKHMLPELVSLASKVEDLFNDIRVPPTSKDDIHEFVVKHILNPLPHWTRPSLHMRGKLKKEKPSDIAVESQDILVYQNVVASVETDFQKIEIVDEADFDAQNRIAHAMEIDPQYLKDSPKLFMPDRAIYMGGVVQSRGRYDAAYHETLVHPGMLQHPHPKRVAIIGGGEGATLREVLKHNTVEEVVMIDIDPGIMEMARQHLPQWSDCGFLLTSKDKGSSTSCFDDERATVYAEDAIQWFLDRFLPQMEEQDDSDDDKNDVYPKFDVIIMDALDPQEDVEFAGVLYNNNDFASSLYNALSDDGVLVTQVGGVPAMKDADDNQSEHRNRLKLERSLAEVGFDRIRHYDGAGTGFEWPWAFYVSFKSYSSEWSWHTSEARVMYEMQRRSIPTREGESPFHFFDGATMLSFRYPNKSREVVFCRRIPTPETCKPSGHGFDLDKPNVPLSSLEVKKSGTGENSGYGLFTKVDIPAISYIGIESSVHSVVFEADTHELLDSFDVNKDNPSTEIAMKAGIDCVLAYVWGYGFSHQPFGKAQTTVEASDMTFVNHGCNGTSNIGWVYDFTEFTADLEGDLAEADQLALINELVFDPFTDRDTNYLYGAATETNRPISSGEEILDNYLDMTGGRRDWIEDVLGLRAMCSGLLGDVEKDRVKRMQHVEL